MTEPTVPADPNEQGALTAGGTRLGRRSRWPNGLHLIVLDQPHYERGLLTRNGEEMDRG